MDTPPTPLAPRGDGEGESTGAGDAGEDPERERCDAICGT